MKDRDLTPRLDTVYYGGPLMHLKKEEAPIAPKPIDLEKQKRRKEIERIVEQRFKNESLEKRLSYAKNGNPSIGNVLNKGLLGFLPDETLISDIRPQGEGLIATDKLIFDPVWEPISENLTIVQVMGVLTIFRAVERISEKLEDEKKSVPVKRALGQDHLLTIGDLRTVSESSWKKMAGIGEASAKVLIEATRKIE